MNKVIIDNQMAYFTKVELFPSITIQTYRLNLTSSTGSEYFALDLLDDDFWFASYTYEPEQFRLVYLLNKHIQSCHQYSSLVKIKFIE